MNEAYKLYCTKITEALRWMVKGYVHTQYNKEDDTITVQIKRGTFEYTTILTDITDAITRSITSEDIAKQIKFRYSKYIQKEFFK